MAPHHPVILEPHRPVGRGYQRSASGLSHEASASYGRSIPRRPARSARFESLNPHYAGGAPERRQLTRIVTDFRQFSWHVIGTPLRPYQLEPAQAILHSILHHQGLTFTVMMSRQAGKNELSAQLEAFLLLRFQHSQVTIVKAAPSVHPQIHNSLLRLERCLDNPLSEGRWTRRLGAIQLRNARVLFFSGAPDSHVVGATASPLLEIDEAQDFDEEKYLKAFRPMAAASNATTVLYGTAWTSDTLLEHVRLENRRLEAMDGIQRNFFYPWAVVADHNADYRTFVQAEELRMGADHPLYRTQYLLESLTSAGRLFSATQLLQVEMTQTRSARPAMVPPGASVVLSDRQPNEYPLTSRTSAPIFVAGIDLAGEDEEAEDSILRALQPQRDSTAVTIAQVTWESTLGVTEARIEVVHFYWWTGRKHRELLPQLVDLLKNVWRCQSVTVDATGVGAGIASFLVGALGADLVHPFTFSAVSKSDLGYQLLSAVNSGRLKIPTGPAPPLTPTSRATVLEGNAYPLAPTPAGAARPLAPMPAGAARPPLDGVGEGWGEGDRRGDAPDSAAVAEFWKQAKLARSALHANQRLSFYVDPREGHDDLLISVALAVEAAQRSRPRVATGRAAQPWHRKDESSMLLPKSR